MHFHDAALVQEQRRHASMQYKIETAHLSFMERGKTLCILFKS